MDELEIIKQKIVDKAPHVASVLNSPLTPFIVSSLGDTLLNRPDATPFEILENIDDLADDVLENLLFLDNEVRERMEAMGVLAPEDGESDAKKDKIFQRHPVLRTIFKYVLIAMAATPIVYEFITKLGLFSHG